MRTLNRLIAPFVFLPLLLLATPSDSADAQRCGSSYGYGYGYGHGYSYGNYGHRSNYRCGPAYTRYQRNRPVYRGRYTRSASRVYRALRSRYSHGYARSCDRRW